MFGLHKLKYAEVSGIQINIQYIGAVLVKAAGSFSYSHPLVACMASRGFIDGPLRVKECAVQKGYKTEQDRQGHFLHMEWIFFLINAFTLNVDHSLLLTLVRSHHPHGYKVLLVLPLTGPPCYWVGRGSFD